MTGHNKTTYIAILSPLWYTIQIMVIPLDELQGIVDKAFTPAFKFACLNQIRDIEKLEELQIDTFLKRTAIHKCEKHQVIHVFDRNRFHDKVNQIAFALREKKQEFPSQSRKQFSKLISDSLNKSHLYLQKSNRELLDFRKSLDGTELAVAGYQARENEKRLNSIAQGIEVPTAKSEPKSAKNAALASLVEISPNVVHRDVLVELYSCFRKIAYSNVEDGEKQISELIRNDKTKGDLRPFSCYECIHCSKFHIGHTSQRADGRIKRAIQYRSAKEYWLSHPDKTNDFIAFKRNQAK